MPLADDLRDWMECSNSLGSEARAGVIIGQIAEHFNEEPTPAVRDALRVLSLRSLLRDAFRELCDAPGERHPDGTAFPAIAFHDLTDAVLACGGISQVEAIAVITQFFQRTLARLPLVDIHAIGGDVVDVAAGIADSVVLWLRDGFTSRHGSWHKLLEKYEDRLGGLNLRTYGEDSIWRSSEDQVFSLEPRAGRLRMIYVFSNPDNALGVSSVDEVRALVTRCLDRLNDECCKSVALIHIPLDRDDGDSVPVKDKESADATIDAIRTWRPKGHLTIGQVFLVDLKDDFKERLNIAAT